MALIPLTEWAKRVGISPATARQKLLRGNLPEAVRMGRYYYIEENTPNPDTRKINGDWSKSKMKEFKVNILKELERLTVEYHSVQLRRAAMNTGVNHLKNQEAHDVLNAFIKAHPEFKIYELSDNPHASFFCAAFVSDNETPPLDPEARV